MSRRWRPSLAFVLGGALIGTLALSFFGLIALRYLGPEIGFRNAAMTLGGLIFLATAVLGWLLVRLLLRPIQGLQAYAEAFETGDDPHPIEHFGTKELHSTAQQVVTMATSLRDREATIRAYTDHVTHELKSPVTAIRAAVEMLEDTPPGQGDADALIAQIDGARSQIETQLAALRDAARAREARYVGACNLSETLRHVSRDHPGISIKQVGNDGQIPLARPGLEVVLGHLVQNAIDHGAREIEFRLIPEPEGTILVVSDTGPGISAGNIDRVFDPFFTTRREVGGTGMGLAIVRNILAAHRGQIRVEPSEKGARFVLLFSN